MKTASIIHAMRERCASFSSRVYGSKSWLKLKDSVNPAAVPVAYVICDQEVARTEDQTSENSFLQLIKAHFQIYIGAPQNDVRGQWASEVLDDLKMEVLSALCGWSPIGDSRAVMQFEDYQPADLASDIVWGQLEMSCTYMIYEKDTWIASVQEGKDSGNPVTKFEGADAQVDMIGQGEKPDGQIDARFKIKDLW